MQSRILIFFSALTIFALDYGLSFKIPLPGGRQVTFNQDTGVLRIQLAPGSALKVPPKGTVPSFAILDCIQVKDTGVKEKGYGAFATGSIEKDAFIGFYEGDFISSREELDSIVSDRRNSTEVNTNVNAAMDYVMSLDGGMSFMDGYSRAQDRSSFSAVHLNHADKGSDECNVIRLLEDDRVAFFTSRDVLEDEELCFDYGKQFWNGRENQKI